MSHINRIAARNFTCYKALKIDLPETGIVAITGENGAGKSSIVEIVAWAFWEKTLRGDVPWIDDATLECEAEVETRDLLFVERSRKGKTRDLDFTWPDQPKKKFENVPKAQEALEESIGSYDLWRKTRVFSSSDATHFSIATDGERKRLIESFLGCDRFDPAVKECRKDLQVATDALAAAAKKQVLLEATLDADKRRLKESSEALEAAKPPDEVRAVAGKPLAFFDDKITQARRELHEIETKLRMAERAGGEYEAAARAARLMLDRLRADRCPTCAQPITEAMRKAEQKKIEKANTDAQAAKDKARDEVGDVEEVVEELKSELEMLQAKRNERAQQLRLEQAAQQEQSRFESQRRMLEDTIKRAKASIAKTKQELVEIEEAIDIHMTDVAELTEVEKVLGLRGVRAHILGTSLSGIEAMTNSWLARLRQGVSVELRPYSEKGPADAISLKICGLGRGTYKSTSGGERRRVDVALLLALGEMQALAQGAPAGTMFFDEVFDCLDDAGVEGVCEVLSELARTRCVVVITHHKPLIERMQAVQRLRIAQGRVEALG